MWICIFSFYLFLSLYKLFCLMLVDVRLVGRKVMLWLVSVMWCRFLVMLVLKMCLI